MFNPFVSICVGLLFSLLAATVHAEGFWDVERLFIPSAEEIRHEAEQGDAQAQLRVGYFYRSQHSYEEAAKWYRKAAEQGLPEAQNALGAVCLLGIGVPQDPQEAMKWFHAAAEQWYAPAQVSLDYVNEDKFHDIPFYNKEAMNWFYRLAEDRKCQRP
ncbi:MAG: sel1 repeat family protein [Magnetococcales bacterium]|nr:sel1 repeat family protein [Magnetococcales bacterium]